MPTARHRPAAAFARWQQLAFFCVAMALLTGWLTRSELLRPPNRLLQDTFVSMLGRDVDDGQVVIVAIDDKSVAELGRWPWRRAYHAELVDRLGQGAPRSIGMDLLLTEPDARYPADDAALAAALVRSGKVVLPLMMQTENGHASVKLPIPVLARSARALGHAHMAVDSDGIARTVYLEEGIGEQRWPYFSVAMLEPRALPAGSAADPVHGTPPHAQGSPDWERSHRIAVPFAGAEGRFERVSYVDVLDGSVAPDFFRGKYVLVGATAAGIGDFYATPMSRSQGLMSGVEFSANVLDAVLNERSMVAAPPWLDLLVNVSCVVLALVAYSLAGPFAALVVSAALILLMPALAGFVLMGFGVQLAPVAAMLGVALAYAVWSWRRLRQAAGYLVRESERLRRQGGIADLVAIAPASGDFLDTRINALSAAADQLSNLHRLVRDTVDGLPDATLVCDRSGRILLANAAAGRYFGIDREQALQGRSAVELMSDVRSSAAWNAAVVDHGTLAETPTQTMVLATDDHGRDLLVKKSPTLSAQGEHTGWILSLLDVTEMRQTQRQRDEAMRFLSHDMREPLSSILTLQALLRQNPEAMPPAQFQERVERHALRAIALSDSFTQLVRAQSAVYQRESHDLGDLLLECVDDAWEATRQHGIGIAIMDGSADEAHSRIDRPLVARAIGNLLGNALKFSRKGTRIRCGIEPLPGEWAILVQDEGPGIEPEAMASLFDPFVRAGASREIQGSGLGLAFVKTVAQRHGGRVMLDSVVGAGSAFRIVLPRA